jgi:hypothetical protein
MRILLRPDELLKEVEAADDAHQLAVPFDQDGRCIA